MSERCALDTRRTLVRRSQLNGLDEVEVERDHRTLLVRFFHNAPEGLTVANLRITGGVAVRDIGITDVQPVASDDPDVPTRLVVSVNRTGDASTYRLHVAGVDGMDPRYSDAPFLFFPDADDGLDCADTVTEITPSAPPPPLDYLAKDYPGFRQLMLDRLAVTLPEWRENHAPDVGIMLVELLAYVADRLSYYQDAVATEAYLATARRRISVRRHVRLIDYAMHEGCNARALVQIDPTTDGPITPSTLTFLLAGQDDSVQFRPLPVPGDWMYLRKKHTAIKVHIWGDSDCVLPKGAVSATLVDPDPYLNEWTNMVYGVPSLRCGDFLIFEVLAGPDSGPDPDPQKRHAVRLTKVVRLVDPLPPRDTPPPHDTPLLQVSWSPEDALPAAFPLDTSTGGPVTVVRGNLLLAHHGRRVSEGSDKPILPRIGPGRRRTIALSTPGLGFAELPVPESASARRVLNDRDPRSAMPLIEELFSWPAATADPYLNEWTNMVYGMPAPPPTDWLLRPDLIESGPDDPHAMLEIEDDGTAILRFGDGVCGRDPCPIGETNVVRATGSDQMFEITYRVGNGPKGNVGADSIARVLPAAVGTVRNPLPASGGTASEDVEQVKLIAPHALRDIPMRASTDDYDYAALAVRLEPAVQRATCVLVPSGGRQLARVALDPFGTDAPNEALERRIATALEPYRQVGHDLTVRLGEYVPLLLRLRVELMGGYIQAHVRAELLAVLGSGVLPDGRLGAFHPDNLTFGTSIYGSRLIAAAQALDGVRAVRIERLERLFDRERGVYDTGALKMAWYEIPQLDNDPLRPDHGRLVVRLIGGLA